MKIFYIGQCVLLFLAGIYVLSLFLGRLQMSPSENFRSSWMIVNAVYGTSALLINGLAIFITIRLIKKIKSNA